MLCIYYLNSVNKLNKGALIRLGQSQEQEIIVYTTRKHRSIKNFQLIFENTVIMNEILFIQKFIPKKHPQILALSLLIRNRTCERCHQQSNAITKLGLHIR